MPLTVGLRGRNALLPWVALLLCHACQCATGQDEMYYDEYSMPWNDTGGDPYSGGAFVASTGPRRSGPQRAYGHHDGRKPRVWTVKMPDGDANAAAAAPSSRKSVLNRRFPGSPGHSGRASGPVAASGQSCPGGVCPNPDLYDEGHGDADDGILGGGDEEPYDMHYDPTYPYDNCHYLGGFSDFRLNGTETCHLRVRGADGHADRLAGGLDGLFLLVGCFEGKPLYIRSRSSGPPGEARVLYFNPTFGAWEFSVGREPSVDQLVLAGDEGHTSPMDVPRWHLAAVFNSHIAAQLPSDDEEMYYVATGVSVMCDDEGDPRLMLTAKAAVAMAAGAAVQEAPAAPPPPPEAPARPGAAGGDVGKSREGPGAGRGREGGRGGAAGRGGGGQRGRERGAAGAGAGGGGEEGKAAARLAKAVRQQFGEDVELSIEIIEEDEEEEGEEGWPAAPPPPPPPLGADGGGREALELEVQELREYWQRHEEEFYESQYPYGEYPPEGLYDDEYGGPGYDDGYGYGPY